MGETTQRDGMEWTRWSKQGSEGKVDRRRKVLEVVSGPGVDVGREL